MAESSADERRHSEAPARPAPSPGIRPRFSKKRGAVLAFAVGATLALAPLVRAETASPAASPDAPIAVIQQHSFAPLVKKVLPAVVNISVTEKPDAAPTSEQQQLSPFPNFPNSPFDQFLRRFFNQQGQGEQGQGDRRHFFFHEFPGPQVKRIALGSGFIIDPSGTVVTNNHVVGNASKVVVILQDGKKYTAKILGRDPKTDLAVLRIHAGKTLPYVSFGNSSRAQVGDWVMAVGNPFGLGGTVTTGIISARGRNIHSGPFDDFLQIDAPINRGNSGGPTFNLAGQVIGINTAIYSPNGGSVGIGFAIPSNTAKEIVAQLIKHGKVSRGWLGVQIQKVTPAIASSLGLDSDHGALVAVVNRNSPAARAGLKQGDVILSFDGKPVKTLRDLPRLVADAAPHSSAQMQVWRDGRAIELQASLGEYPSNPQLASAEGWEEGQDSATAAALGMHFAPLTSDLRRELHVGKKTQGVVVTRVDNGSPADSAGITAGDVVVAIGREPVHSPRQAAEKLHAAAHSAAKSALLLLDRHGMTEYVGLSVGEKNG